MNMYNRIRDRGREVLPRYEYTTHDKTVSKESVMAPRSLLKSTLFALFAVFAAAGCSDDDGGSGPGTGGVGGVDIGPGGGSVTSEDAKFTIDIPAGALSTTQTISVAKMETPEIPATFDGLRVEEAYDIQPDGLTFSAPATITFVRTEPGLESSIDFEVVPEAIFTEDATGAIEKLDGGTMEFDAATGFVTITGATSHLSPFVCISERDFETGDPDLSVNFSLSQGGGDLSRFDLSTTIAYKSETSNYELPFELSNQTDPADAIPAGSGNFQFNLGSFGGGETAEHTMTFGCETDGIIDARVRLTLDSAFTGSDELRVRLRTSCEESGGPGPSEAIRLEFDPGVELAATISLPNKEWDDRPPGEFDYLLVATSTNSFIYDLTLGAVAFDTGLGYFFGALAIEDPANDGDLTSAVVSGGAGGGIFKSYSEENGFDNFALSFGFQNGLWDIVNAGSSAFTYIEGTNQARGSTYDEKGNTGLLFPLITSNQLDSGNIGPLRGVLYYQPSGKWARATADLMILADGPSGAAGKIFVGDSQNTSMNLSSVATVGTDPRRMRHAEEIVAVSNFGSDDLTVLLWQGTTVTVGETSIPVGDGPVGIDLIRLSNGNTAISSTGFNDDSYSITIVDASGNLVSNDKFDVPFEGTAPGHATWTRRGEEIWIIVSCNASGDVILIPTELQ